MVLALVILWFLAVSRTALWWLGLWQLKEYRFDRLRVHITTSEGRRQFLSGLGLARILAGFFVFPLLGAAITPLALLVYYAGEALYTGFIISQRRFKRPKPTLRAGLITVASLVSAAVGAWWLFSVAGLGALLGVHGFMALIITVWVVATEPFTRLVKGRIIRRAAAYRATLKHLTVVGVTGSYGKTSTKVFLTHILKSADVRVVSPPGNVNSVIGLADFLLHQVTPLHSVLVAEMAAYTMGEIAQSATLLAPSIGIVTAINDQHMALFGSRANIISAKYELIQALSKSGTAIFNDDDEACHAMAGRTSHLRVILFSQAHRADVYADNIRQGKGNLDFTLHAEGGAVAISAPVIGTHLTSTLLAAASAALALGVPLNLIAESAKSITVPYATMEIQKGFKGATIIDDSYSANPDGVAAALTMLREYSARKRFVLMRPMIELGRYGAAAHRTLGGQLAQSCDYAFFVNHDFEAEIREGAGEKGMTRDRLMFSRSVGAMAERLNDFVEAGDVVLLENRIPAGLKRLITLRQA